MPNIIKRLYPKVCHAAVIILAIASSTHKDTQDSEHKARHLRLEEQV